MLIQQLMILTMPEVHVPVQIICITKSSYIIPFSIVIFD